MFTKSLRMLAIPLVAFAAFGLMACSTDGSDSGNPLEPPPTRTPTTVVIVVPATPTPQPVVVIPPVVPPGQPPVAPPAPPVVPPPVVAAPPSSGCVTRAMLRQVIDWSREEQEPPGYLGAVVGTFKTTVSKGNPDYVDETQIRTVTRGAAKGETGTLWILPGRRCTLEAAGADPGPQSGTAAVVQPAQVAPQRTPAPAAAQPATNPPAQTKTGAPSGAPASANRQLLLDQIKKYITPTGDAVDQNTKMIGGYQGTVIQVPPQAVIDNHIAVIQKGGKTLTQVSDLKVGDTATFWFNDELRPFPSYTTLR